MVSTDPYRLLAGRLGYPDSPALRRILEFLIQENKVAEIVVELPTPLDRLAHKFQMTEEEVKNSLQKMQQRGIITLTSRGHFFVRNIKELYDAALSKNVQDSPYQDTLGKLWRIFFKGNEVEKKRLTINDLKVEQEIGPIDWIVTMDQAENIIRSTRRRDPWYWEEAAGDARIAPPTIASHFYDKLLSTKYDTTGPLLAYSTHVSQEDEFFNPIFIGARLKLLGKIVGIVKEKKYVTIEVEVTDENGTLLARSRSVVGITSD